MKASPDRVACSVAKRLQKFAAGDRVLQRIRRPGSPCQYILLNNDPTTKAVTTQQGKYLCEINHALPEGRKNSLVHGPVKIQVLPACIFQALWINILEMDAMRSEEHTSELQSHSDLVCRLLLEKKKKIKK